MQTLANQKVNFVEIESKVRFIVLKESIQLISKLLIAGRYVTVTNESSGVNSEDELVRTQLGVGYRSLDHIMFKTKVVSQTEEENSAGQIGSDWSGLILETSLIF